MRAPSSIRILLVLIATICLASVAAAQAAPTCGVPGAPVCTSTPEPTRQRPTDAPTQAPAADQPAQATTEPTATPAATALPLLAMPETEACIAAPNGSFRVNVRDIPSTDGEIVGVLGENDAVVVLAVFTNDANEDWLLTSAGWVLAAAMRTNGEDCDGATAAKLAKSSRIVIRIDFAPSEEPESESGIYRDLLGRGVDAAAGITKLGSRRLTLLTDEDECTPASVVAAAGEAAQTVCTPLPDDAGLSMCVKKPNGGTVCFIIRVDVAAADAEPVALEAVFGLIDGEQPDPDFPLIFWAFPLPDGASGNEWHGETGGDVCIEYNYANPWGGGGTFCLAADLGPGDVACVDDHCVVIVD